MKNLHNVLSTYRTVVVFVLLVAIITVIFGAIYGAGQQIYRANANDPQVEVIDQLSQIIKQDVPLEAIVNGEEAIDLHESLSLFVMIFDAEKKLAGASAKIDGESPIPPSEAFDIAKQKGEYRFTWEPKDGVRIAAVLAPVDDKGYALAGKSLAEIDQRIYNLTLMVVVGWAVSVVLAALLTVTIRPNQTLAIIEETNVTVVEEPKQSE